MNAIYLRVSTDELDESDQLPEILKCFNLVEAECLVLRERVSAYKEDAQVKRTEFLELKRLIEAKEVSELYVYSLERIERNIIRMFEFFFFCEANDCKIHGVLQPSLEMEFEDSPFGTFSRYMQVLMFGLLGENESYMTSKRTKKAYMGDGTSSYGKKWGDKLRNLEGKKVDVDLDVIKSMKDRIYELLSMRKTGKEIKVIVANEFKLSISEMYISRLRKAMKNV